MSYNFINLIVIFIAIFSAIKAADIPTLYPVDPFNPREDAQRLRDAMSGLGTDESAIIDVLCRRPANQRVAITQTYNDAFGRDLLQDLEDELVTGAFETLALSLPLSMAKFLAIELYYAMFLLSSNELTLTEVLLSRNNLELEQIRLEYLREYGHELIDDIRDNFSLGLEEMFVTMAQGLRDESSIVDPQLVVDDARDLYLSAQGRPGSDEPSFALIFSLRSFAHLLSIEEVYLINYQVPLRIVIEDEFIGSFRDSLLAHLDYANNKADYFARRLYSTIAGTGTDENALNRQILSRCEIDLENIKNEYEKIFLTTLRNAVADDTSGPHEEALLTLIN